MSHSPSLPDDIYSENNSGCASSPRQNQSSDISSFKTAGTKKRSCEPDDNADMSIMRQERLSRERRRARRNRLQAKQKRDDVQYQAKVTEQLHGRLLVENQELKCHVEKLNEEIRMLRSTQMRMLMQLSARNTALASSIQPSNPLYQAYTSQEQNHALQPRLELQQPTLPSNYYFF